MGRKSQMLFGSTGCHHHAAYKFRRRSWSRKLSNSQNPPSSSSDTAEASFPSFATHRKHASQSTSCRCRYWANNGRLCDVLSYQVGDLPSPTVSVWLVWMYAGGHLVRQQIKSDVFVMVYPAIRLIAVATYTSKSMANSCSPQGTLTC